MARRTLNDLSFENYLAAGGWRGYAQSAAKDAFVTEACSWLEPLQKMLETEQARLLALENTTADDFLLVAAIRRDLSKLKRYLKISNTVEVTNQAAPPRPETKTKRMRPTRR